MSLSTYHVGQTFFCRETGRKHEAGETVDLEDSVAASYNSNHPGLLKPALQNAQAKPSAARSVDPTQPKAKPQGRKSRATR